MSFAASGTCPLDCSIIKT